MYYVGYNDIQKYLTLLEDSEYCQVLVTIHMSPGLLIKILENEVPNSIITHSFNYYLLNAYLAVC
jgi:hypothetical protein